MKPRKRSVPADYTRQALVLKALAHPARLTIIHSLSSGPVCVCELTKAVGSDISTVSQHLGLLRNAGLVDSEKKANRVFYSLKCPCVLEFLLCIAQITEPRARHGAAAPQE